MLASSAFTSMSDWSMEMYETSVCNYSTVQEAFLYELNNVVTYGETIEVRGSKVKEILNRTIVIREPWKRCLIVHGRNDNIFAKIAETLWMIAGRDDLDWLARYVPRVYDYSDDGCRWRGAYGPRIRKWTGGHPYYTDQLMNVVDLLVADPNTRRAVISIWDPSIDVVDGLDIPCNNWLHFYIRGDKLHLNVAQRSSDILWGLSGIDVFQWSVLMDVVAAMVGVKVGWLRYFISNLHLYDKHWVRADKILNDRREYDYLYDYNVTSPQPSKEYFLDDLERVFAWEESFRDNRWCNACDDPRDEILATCVGMLRAYNIFLNKTDGYIDSLASCLFKIKKSDFKFSTT